MHGAKALLQHRLDGLSEDEEDGKKKRMMEEEEQFEEEKRRWESKQWHR
jgi:hypothetical protein